MTAMPSPLWSPMKDGCSTKGGLPWFSNSLILVSDVHHARTLHPKKTLQWSKLAIMILTWKPRLKNLWSICWVIRVKTRHRVLNMNLFSGSGVRMGVRRESSVNCQWTFLLYAHSLLRLELHISLLSAPTWFYSAHLASLSIAEVTVSS